MPLVIFYFSYRKSLWVIMKGSEFHKEMETGEVQGRNISRKGGHALALAHELVSLSWQKLDAIYSFFFVPPLSCPGEPGSS